MSTPLATAIGPFLGMYISQNADYSAIFMVCSIISAASILMAIFLSVKDVKLTNNQLEEMKGFKIGSFIEPKVISIAVTSLAVCFCIQVLFHFFPYMQRKSIWWMQQASSILYMRLWSLLQDR
jgi:predicted MFS family arabinose efflux permease